MLPLESQLSIVILTAQGGREPHRVVLHSTIAHWLKKFVWRHASRARVPVPRCSIQFSLANRAQVCANGLACLVCADTVMAASQIDVNTFGRIPTLNCVTPRMTMTMCACVRSTKVRRLHHLYRSPVHRQQQQHQQQVPVQYPRQLGLQAYLHAQRLFKMRLWKRCVTMAARQRCALALHCSNQLR